MQIKLPIQRLDATFRAAEADERVVPMTVYAGAMVTQFSWESGLHNLQLSMEPKAVRLGRLNSGRAPFLNSHNTDSLGAILGTIAKGSAKLDGDKLTASVRFSKRADVEPIFQDVLDGVLCNVSVGARLNKLKEITREGDKIKTFVATDWEPTEVSAVAVGADPGAHFASAENAETECEIEFAEGGVSTPQEIEMAENTATQETGAGARTAVELDVVRLEASTSERARVLDITKLGAKLNLVDLASAHVAGGNTLADFRAAALDAIAAREEETPTRVGNASVTRDAADTRRAAFSQALLHRFDPAAYPVKPADPGYDYRGLASGGLLRMAEECVRHAGKNPARMSPLEIAEFGLHSTSDLPYILASVADTTMKKAFALAPNNWAQITERKTVSNFKTQNLLDLGLTGAFQLVPEGGEYKAVTVTESKDTFKVLTYAAKIGFTRQVIINDSLGALTDIPARLARKAAQKQAELVWKVVTDNGVLASDSVALFDNATHANYTASGTAISIDNLGLLRAKMRAQTDKSGDIADIMPKYLVVPVAKEQLAMQYLSSAYNPVGNSTINPWAGTMTLIVEPRLDASSATAWYMFADPADAPVLVAVYLSGYEGVFSETRTSVDIDGVEFRVRMDFGAGAIDYRGAAKNVGA